MAYPGHGHAHQNDDQTIGARGDAVLHLESDGFGTRACVGGNKRGHYGKQRGADADQTHIIRRIHRSTLPLAAMQEEKQHHSDQQRPIGDTVQRGV